MSPGKHKHVTIFLTFGPQPKLKGKHVVFGEIISGMEVLERIEKESKPDEKFVPQIPVVCGPVLFPRLNSGNTILRYIYIYSVFIINVAINIR